MPTVIKATLDFLSGKKTNIAATVLMVLGGLKAAGMVDEELYQALTNIVAGVALVFLRMGISKLGS